MNILITKDIIGHCSYEEKLIPNMSIPYYFWNQPFWFSASCQRVGAVEQQRKKALWPWNPARTTIPQHQMVWRTTDHFWTQLQSKSTSKIFRYKLRDSQVTHGSSNNRKLGIGSGRGLEIRFNFGRVMKPFWNTYCAR